MFQSLMDLNAFYRQGYLVTEIDPAVADAMLAEMEREAWVSIHPENNEGADNPYARKYDNRFIAADSLLRPMSPKPLYAAYRDAFMQWASTIFQEFEHADKALLTALAGGQGYHMDLHADAGDRSLFTTLLYLGHGTPEPNPHGGNLELVRVDAHRPHEGDQELLDCIVPVHGRVVIMNNLDPTVYHRVTPFKKPEGFRYQLFGSFGINDEPDWHLDGGVPDACQGVILNPELPLTMGDADKVVALLRNWTSKATN